MEALYELFTAELSKKISPSKGKQRRSISSTVLQINRIPHIIDLNYYKNPHSADNPTGNYAAAYRLYSLADEAPELTLPFFSGMNSIKSIWGNIVNSATSEEISVINLLANAQEDFKNSKMSGMGGVPEDWYPVYARPFNWYELILDKNNLTRIEVNSFNEQDPFFWSTDSSAQISLNPKTVLDKIYIDVLVVNFIRPWLNFEVFQSDWKIKGLRKGYYSNGSLRENSGIFPLVTKSMLVGTNASIEGKFASEDMNILSSQKANNLSFGPVSLNGGTINKEENKTFVSSTVTQVVGYISQLIPLCPQE